MTIIEREREQVQVDVERERRANVLEAAALEIEYRGWCQNAFEDEQGRVCLMTAIALNHSCQGDDVSGANAYEVFAPDGRVSLAGWNDGFFRTAGEVCFVLRWRAQEIRDGR